MAEEKSSSSNSNSSSSSSGNSINSSSSSASVDNHNMDKKQGVQPTKKEKKISADENEKKQDEKKISSDASPSIQNPQHSSHGEESKQELSKEERTAQLFIDEVNKLYHSDKVQTALGNLKDKRVIFFFGVTGCGKGTTINYLLGHNIILQRDHLQEECKLIIKQKHGLEVCSTGGGKESHTFLPALYKTEWPDIFFCDCPGFGDSRGAVHETVIAMMINSAVKITKSAKIILIMDSNTLIAKNGAFHARNYHVALTLNSLNTLIPLKNNDNIGLLVAKTDHKKNTPKEFTAKIKSNLQEASKNRVSMKFIESCDPTDRDRRQTLLNMMEDLPDAKLESVNCPISDSLKNQLTHLHQKLISSFKAKVNAYTPTILDIWKNYLETAQLTSEQEKNNFIHFLSTVENIINVRPQDSIRDHLTRIENLGKLLPDALQGSIAIAAKLQQFREDYERIATIEQLVIVDRFLLDINYYECFFKNLQEIMPIAQELIKKYDIDHHWGSYIQHQGREFVEGLESGVKGSIMSIINFPQAVQNVMNLLEDIPGAFKATSRAIYHKPTRAFGQIVGGQLVSGMLGVGLTELDKIGKIGRLAHMEKMKGLVEMGKLRKVIAEMEMADKVAAMAIKGWVEMSAPRPSWSPPNDTKEAKSSPFSSGSSSLSSSSTDDTANEESAHLVSREELEEFFQDSSGLLLKFQLFKAIEKGDQKNALMILKHIHQEYPSDSPKTYMPGGEEEPALFTLARFGHRAWLDDWLPHFRLDITDTHGNWILHMAAKEGQIKFFEALLEKNIVGGRTEGGYEWPKNEYGETPLHAAAMEGQVNFLMYCNKHYNAEQDLQASTSNGDTIVHLLIRYHHFESLKKLLDNCPFLSVCSQNLDSHDPLMLGLMQKPDSEEQREKQYALVDHLLTKHVDFTKRDIQGRTALHLAALTRDVNLVRKLLDKGALLEVRDHQGKQPDHDDYAKPDSEIGILLSQKKVIDKPKKGGHFRKKRREPRNLVFQGGSVRGLAYPAALREMEEKGLCSLTKIQRVGGTSAGAITALLVGLGYTLDEIDHLTGVKESKGSKLPQIKFSELLDGEFGPLLLATIKKSPAEIKESAKKTVIDTLKKAGIFCLGLGKFYISPGVMSAVNAGAQGAGLVSALYEQSGYVSKAKKIYSQVNENLGLCPGKKLYELFDQLIRMKLAEKRNVAMEKINYVTFRELQEAGFKGLYFVGVNTSTGVAEYFSYDHTPDMLVASAVRISMSIPGVFVPVPKMEKIKGSIVSSKALYIDGGICLNYPIRLFDFARYSDDRSLLSDRPQVNETTLGLRLVSSAQKERYEERILSGEDENMSTSQGDLLSIFGFLTNALDILYNGQQESEHSLSGDFFRTIYIDPLDVGMLDFERVDDPHVRQLLAVQGQEGVRDFINRIEQNKVFQVKLPDELSNAVKKHSKTIQEKVEGDKRVTVDEINPNSPQLVVEFYSYNDIQLHAYLHDHLKVLLLGRDREGRTAFHIAAANGNLKVLQRLLNACPDGAVALDFNKKTPAELEEVSKHPEVLALLQEYQHSAGTSSRLSYKAVQKVTLADTQVFQERPLSEPNEDKYPYQSAYTPIVSGSTTLSSSHSQSSSCTTTSAMLATPSTMQLVKSSEKENDEKKNNSFSYASPIVNSSLFSLKPCSSVPTSLTTPSQPLQALKQMLQKLNGEKGYTFTCASLQTNQLQLTFTGFETVAAFVKRGDIQKQLAELTSSLKQCMIHSGISPDAIECIHNFKNWTLTIEAGPKILYQLKQLLQTAGLVIAEDVETETEICQMQ